MIVLDDSQIRKWKSSASSHRGGHAKEAKCQTQRKLRLNSKPTEDNASESEISVALPKIHRQSELGPNRGKHDGGLSHTASDITLLY